MISEKRNSAEQAVTDKSFGLLYMMLEGKKYSHTEIVDAAKQVLAFPMINVPQGHPYYEDILEAIVERYEIEVGIKTFDPYILAKKKQEGSWLYKVKAAIPHAFFDRYKQYLRREGFPIKSIENIESSCEKILSYCANPKNESKNEHRRGLVVGDVQSGKTANYLGLINMAYDYGYRIVVLLAGTTNSLRLQTQKRTDSGVIGAKSDTIGNQIEYCGVGISNGDHYVVPFTNQTNDFAKFIQRNLNAEISDFRKPVVLVVKKNTRILESVIERLQSALKDFDSSSILVIDDEADYASVNTTRPGNEPTATNNCIRTIFNNFPISTYIGFTATPFANIFINPYDDDKEYLDLFPADFIVQLNAPDTYFGGADVFPTDGENLPRSLRLLKEDEPNFIPVIHKKEYCYTGLAESLKEAIHVFLINNVIRTVRGDNCKHRSMMINITRYNDVQSKISEYVTDYVEELFNIIEQDSSKKVDDFIRNQHMKELYDLYLTNDFYAAIRSTIPWETIQKGLYGEVKQFQTVVVNSRNGKMNHISKGETGERFDYEQYEKEGARVIVIGGLVLSRGLTLEGLMVSYYSRNARTYDTLLQMCRWFGYRPRYKDLCRIYMSQVNIDSFVAALSAVNDLKEQFREMEIHGKTPKEFGLMVKESPDILETSLLVTSRNKMFGTKEIIYHLNYGGVYADTSKLSIDPAVNDHNTMQFERFYEELHFQDVSGRYMAQSVHKSNVADLIRNLKIPYVNTKFDTEALSEYIENSDIFQSWDVVIATGSSKKPFLGTHLAVERSFHLNDLYIKIGGPNNRVMEPGILNAGLGLTSDEKKKILEEKNRNSEKHYDDLTALDYLKRRRCPLLIIYPIDLRVTDSDGLTNEDKLAVKAALGGKLLLAFAIGFPATQSKVVVKYRANRVKLDELTRNIEVDDEDEGVEDTDD